MKYNKASIQYSEPFEDMVLKKAIEMEKTGLVESVLDQKTLGELKVYINHKPAFCIYHINIKEDSPVLAGKTISVGAETM